MRKTCAICGAMIDPEPVEATPPEDARKHWYEIYECENGHEGRLEVDEPREDNGWQRDERLTGALRPDSEVIA